MSQLTVHVSEYANPTAAIRWDEDGHSVICNIDYAAAHSHCHESNPDLRQLIDERLNIRTRDYVINAGMLSMLFDSEKRLEAFDFYTNPMQWTVCSIAFVEAMPRTAQIDAVFDINGQGESLAEPAALYEPRRGTLYLSWAEASIWYALAPCLAFGVTNDNRLAQIRLDGLYIQQDLKKKHPVALWAMLRRRFVRSHG